MRRSDLAAVLVLLLAAALVLLARPSPPPPAPVADARTAPVEHASLVCPAADEAANVTAAVSSLPVGAPAGPRVSPVRLDRGPGPQRRGATWSGDVGGDGLEVSADGPLAAGLEAASAAVFADRSRGLATAACRAPAAHWWFVGAASTPDRSGVLQLANPTTGVAVVDVAFHGPRGPLDAATTGLAVAPGERTSLPLAGVVGGARSVAVEVTARQGRVAAALTETARDGLDPAGVDLLPPAAEPRRTAVVSGVPGRADAHTLAVANAGAAPAVVEVEVLGPRGPFTPTSLEHLPVPAGGVAEVPIPTGVLDGDTAGIRLTSAQPVTATVRSSTGTGPAELSFAAANEPVRTLTGAPVLPGLDGELVLSGTGDAAAVADVATHSATGAPLRRRTLDIGGGQTRAVPLTGGAASVVVRVRGPGSVAAAVLWSRADGDGMLASGYPLSPARLRIELPGVRYRLAPAQPS
jgi:hypothetical protein